MKRMTRVLAVVLFGFAMLGASAEEKGKTMSGQAKGTFEVKLEPIAGSDPFPRLAMKKEWHGDLEATSAGEMMSIGGSVEGSGAYVALERITGTLGGRKGSFALVHSGTMQRGGDFSMIIRIVPDSGTDELTGISGTLQILFEGKNHLYQLDYTLPE